MRLAILGALGAATLMLIPAVASAGPRGKRGFGHGGRGGGIGKLMRGNLKRIAKRLNLTQAQVSKLKQLRAQNKGKMAKTRLKMARVKAKMRVEWLADKPSAWKLRKLHKRMQALKAKAATRRFNIRLKVSQILTPTQRMKLRKVRGHGRRFARWGSGKGKRFGNRGRGHGRRGFGR